MASKRGAVIDRQSEVETECTPEEPSDKDKPEPTQKIPIVNEDIGPMPHEEFSNLGELLRYLRDTYPDRTGQNIPGRPRVNLTALSLIACLKDHGYPITSGSYSLLESGRSLPQDPMRFFEAIGQCLAVSKSDIYWGLLRQQYAFDLVARSVGPDEAERMVPHGKAYEQMVKEGRFPSPA